MSSTRYPGTELDLFARAANWKAYLRHLIAPYLRGRVLEVGGGIGATTCAFRSPAQQSWMTLEPDAELSARLRDCVASLDLPVQVVTGTIEALPEGPLFDSVLYVDVLEHIEDDGAELRLSAARLAPGGVIVVLSPAHQRLYTPFDAAIGHFRRYGRRRLRTITPPGTSLIDLRYLDSLGLVLTLGNKLLLRSASPTLGQVLLWDRWVVPLSRRLDPLTGGRVGKSILAVWRRNASR